MSDYFDATMRLYLEKLLDWDSLLGLLRDGKVDREAEVGAYRSVLETVAALAESFERPAREAWEAEAELVPDGGAQPPAHIRKAYDSLRENGLPRVRKGAERRLPIHVRARFGEGLDYAGPVRDRGPHDRRCAGAGFGGVDVRAILD